MVCGPQNGREGEEEGEGETETESEREKWKTRDVKKTVSGGKKTITWLDPDQRGDETT